MRTIERLIFSLCILLPVFIHPSNFWAFFKVMLIWWNCLQVLNLLWFSFGFVVFCSAFCILGAKKVLLFIFIGLPTSCRCFFLGRSYSLAGKRVEAYALYCRARSLAENALKKFQAASDADQVCRWAKAFSFLWWRLLFV